MTTIYDIGYDIGFVQVLLYPVDEAQPSVSYDGC